MYRALARIATSGERGSRLGGEEGEDGSCVRQTVWKTCGYDAAGRWRPLICQPTLPHAPPSPFAADTEARVMPMAADVVRAFALAAVQPGLPPDVLCEVGSLVPSVTNLTPAVTNIVNAVTNP